MDVLCPSCRSRIAPADVNVFTDIALCRSCGNTFRLSEIIGAIPTTSVDLHSPPSGAWYTPMADGFVAGATTRTWMALFLVPFTCVWAGGSMAAIYGTQIMKGQFSLFPSLFGLPFLVGSIGWTRTCALSDFSTVREGYGGLGNWNWNSRQGPSIRLEGKRAVAFGSMLSTERRYFLLKVLQTALNNTTRSTVFSR